MTTDPVDGRIGPRISRTRDKVLRAANELLEEVGFGQVTIDDISDRSGVSRSTMYRHWQSRDDILRDAFSAKAVVPDDDAAGLEQSLRTYATAFADGLHTAWGVAAVTLSVSALDDPEQRAVQQVFVDGYRRDIDALLRRARRRGEVPDDLDLPTAVDGVVVDVIAPLFYTFLFEERAMPAAAVDALVARACSRFVGRT